MANGDNLKEWWKKYHRGEVQLSPNHGKRGKDKPETIRKIKATDKTLANRYYERTGRRLEIEMQNQRDMIELMVREAGDIEDQEKRFEALARAQSAMATFNQTFLPYLEQKLGELKSDIKLEDKISLEDALDESVQISQVKSQEITDETE